MGQRSLDDVIGIFGHQLRALGHEAVRDVKLEKEGRFLAPGYGVNFIVEGFTMPVVARIAEARAQGCRFLCLATEEPTPKGFNHGRDPEMVRRQECFAAAAPHFDGILHLVPGEPVTRWYSAFAPSAQVELGYAPTLVRAASPVEPVFDFGFFGSVSPRRLKILKRLSKRIGTPKAVRIVGDFATQTDRDRIMREARVIVQIRKFDEMGLVSSSRCNTALCIGRPVVAEPHELSKPWDEIVRFSSSLESFYDEAIIVRTAWKGVHADQFRRFKERLSPEFCVGRALEQIGFKDEVEAA